MQHSALVTKCSTLHFSLIFIILFNQLLHFSSVQFFFYYYFFSLITHLLRLYHSQNKSTRKYPPFHFSFAIFHVLLPCNVPIVLPTFNRFFSLMLNVLSLFYVAIVERICQYYECIFFFKYYTEQKAEKRQKH